MDSSLNECSLWMYKSDRAIEGASTLFRMGHYSDSISRSYYAVFYCLKALFAQDNIKAQKPTMMLSVLGKHHVKQGKLEPCYHKLIYQIFDLRFHVEYECKNQENIEDAKFALENANIVINEIKTNLIKNANEIEELALTT